MTIKLLTFPSELSYEDLGNIEKKKSHTKCLFLCIKYYPGYCS